MCVCVGVCMCVCAQYMLYNVHVSSTQLYIIESVDSISRDGPDVT